jgi:hypothetical protein
MDSSLLLLDGSVFTRVVELIVEKAPKAAAVFLGEELRGALRSLRRADRDQQSIRI